MSTVDHISNYDSCTISLLTHVRDQLKPSLTSLLPTSASTCGRLLNIVCSFDQRREIKTESQVIFHSSTIINDRRHLRRQCFWEQSYQIFHFPAKWQNIKGKKDAFRGDTRARENPSNHVKENRREKWSEISSHGTFAKHTRQRFF